MQEKGPRAAAPVEPCGGTFSGTAGFNGMHFDQEVIVRALSMTASGMSPPSGEVRRQPKPGGVVVGASSISGRVSIATR